MSCDKEQKIVFALAMPSRPGDPPTLILGIPAGCWEYIKDSKTATVDLTKGGVNLNVIAFGGDNHAHVMELLRQAGMDTDKFSNRDFGIKPRLDS